LDHADDAVGECGKPEKRVFPMAKQHQQQKATDDNAVEEGKDVDTNDLPHTAAGVALQTVMKPGPRAESYLFCGQPNKGDAIKRGTVKNCVAAFATYWLGMWQRHVTFLS